MHEKWLGPANSTNELVQDDGLTSTVESLAAMAKISAQETVRGQAFSSADLISSITSNPRTDFLFGTEFFSLVMPPPLSKRSDASHPFKSKQSRLLHCEKN